MRTIIVKNCRKESCLLTNYIRLQFPSLSQNLLFKALRNKDIKINCKRVSNNTKVFENDVIDIYIDDIYLYNLPKKINYIYTDNNIIIAFKPQGILSNNEAKHIEEPTFEDLVKKDYEKARICHRLDRNTSGLIIFSLNETAHENILRGFENNNIIKEYIAYVSNYKFKVDHEVLENYIITDKKNGFSKVYSKKIPNSSKIITEYNVIKKNINQNYAILNVKIKTGKTHQIRAQFKIINHPIIGDPKYGDNNINKKFNINKQLLFAYKYTFSFDKYSYFSYLNGKIFKLDEYLYNFKIGDFNEKNRKK